MKVQYEATDTLTRGEALWIIGELHRLAGIDRRDGTDLSRFDQSEIRDRVRAKLQAIVDAP